MKQSKTTKKVSSTKSISLDALIKQTKALDKKLGLQNNMTSSVNFEQVMQICERFPSGISPQGIAKELGMLDIVATDKQVRKMFQNMKLSKDNAQSIVKEFGNYAYRISLKKNGNKNLYVVERFNITQ